MTDPAPDSRGIACRQGRLAFLRSVLAVVLLTMTVTTGMVFQTQTQAHAFLPAAAAVVAPTVARTVAVPIARAACQSLCRGAIAWGAGVVGNAAAAGYCFFVTGDCTVPWQNDPAHGPNSDFITPQGFWSTSMVTFAGGGNSWLMTVQVDADNNVLVTGTGPSPSSTRGVDVRCYTSSGEPVASAALPSDGTVLLPYNGGAGCWGASNRVQAQAWWTNPEDGYTYTGSVVTFHFGTPKADGTGPQPHDPTRKGQGYRKCQDSTGATVVLAGPPTDYKESTTYREVALPTCPATHPIPAGGGISKGSPWTPDTVTPVPPTMPEPIVPDVGRPSPEILPKQPTDPAEKPRRTPPGTPDGEPLPEIDPVTGKPVPDPNDPTKPKPQPLPPPVPDEGPCMWGGYQVDPADCEGAPAPEAPPEPSPSPTSSATPAPFPTSGPNPRPDDPTLPEGPTRDEDTQGCLAKEWSWNPVSWVLAPVKCALVWAFVPRDGFVEGKVTGVRDEWGDTGPGRIIGATGGVVTKVGDLAGGADGCSGPAVRFDSGFLKTTLRPLAACPGDLAHSAARVVRIITTVGLYLGAAALVARILASSLGLQLPGFGRGDDA
jgi:hypothetical protein